jgi:hypothetical protein
MVKQGPKMAGVERKVKAMRRQLAQAEKRAAKAARKRERKAHVHDDQRLH